MFSGQKMSYLRSQPLARLATVSADGQPVVDSVGFEFRDGWFYAGGMDLPASRKYKNVAGGGRKVALTLDDLESVSLWKPRSIRVFGTAQVVEREGRFGRSEYLAVSPTDSWSWDIEDREGFRDGMFTPKKTVWKED